MSLRSDHFSRYATEPCNSEAAKIGSFLVCLKTLASLWHNVAVQSQNNS